MKSYLITDIPDEDWEKFIAKIPRNKTINEEFKEIIKRIGREK